MDKSEIVLCFPANALLTTLFCTALVDVLDRAESITGLFVKSEYEPLVATIARSPGCTAVAPADAPERMAARSVMVACLSSKALCRSVWLDSVPPISPHLLADSITTSPVFPLTDLTGDSVAIALDT